jgi:hypothetical protein
MGSLLGLARAEQERAKRLLRNCLIAHGVTLVLGLVSLMLSGPWVFMVAVVALLSEGAAWWFRSIGLEAHVLSETGRRRALIERELGRYPDSLGTAQLTTQFSDWATQHAAQWDDPTYYSETGQPAGPARLRMALQESAFWSSQLYKAAARGKLIRLCLVAVMITISALLVSVVEAGTPMALAARATTVALATLIAVDVISSIMSLFSAARVSEQVVRQLDDDQVSDLGQMLVVFADYSVATALSAPIPTRLYLAQHDRIDKAWKARLATASNGL